MLSQKNYYSKVKIIEPKLKMTISEIPSQVLRDSLHFRNPQAEKIFNPGKEIYFDPKKGEHEWLKRIQESNKRGDSINKNNQSFASKIRKGY